MRIFIEKAKLIYGAKSLEKIPYELGTFSAMKPLIIYDKTAAGIGLLHIVKKAFKVSDIAPVSYMANTVETADLLTLKEIISYYNNHKCDSIIALGLGGVIDLSKALKLTANVGTDSIDNIESIDKSVNNIVPLIVIPILLGSPNAGTHKAKIYDTMRNKCYDINSVKIAPDVIVMDKRMQDVMSDASICESAICSLGMSLSANIDNLVSILAKAYSHTAMVLFRENFLQAGTKWTKENKLAMMASIIYGGIAFSEIQDGLLDSLITQCSRYKDISYRKVFICVITPYLELFMNKQNLENSMLLADLIGIEKYAYIPKEQRVDKLMELLKNINAGCRKSIGMEYSLSYFGVNADDIPKIAAYTLESLNSIDNEELRRIITEILNRAL